MAKPIKRKKRKGVEFRADRNKWGYRVCLQGRTLKRYAWATREEAKAALIELKQELASKPKEPELPPTALITVAGAYLIDAAEESRSQWRLNNVRSNFNSVIPVLRGGNAISLYYHRAGSKNGDSAKAHSGTENIVARRDQSARIIQLGNDSKRSRKKPW